MTGREWADLQETLLKLDRFPAEAPSSRLRTQFYAMLDTHLRSAGARLGITPGGCRQAQVLLGNQVWTGGFITTNGTTAHLNIPLDGQLEYYESPGR